MQIAVIGAGIAGLSTAYWLDRQHQVTVFEANNYLGGHTNTVDVEVDGEIHSVDTGFIVFNDRTYPNFVSLLDELGVSSRPTSMGFSLRCERTGLEYNGSSLNQLFTQRRNLVRPSFYRMVRDILRFNRDAPRQVLAGELAGAERMTVGEFVGRQGYSREFVQHFLLPMGSAVWSCPLGVFEEFPIRFIVEFYQNHGLLNWRDRPTWRVIDGGSRTYVAALVQRISGEIHTSTPIRSVRRLLDRVELTPQNGASRAFDHVVFACHSDQALRLLSDPSPSERELLGAFPYQRSEALLHTDASVLPRHRRAWASWNYLLPREPASGATVTYCMNILQQLRSRQVLNVSLNCEQRIDPSQVLGRFVYEHPVFTLQRAAAQARHHELINANRTSYCGAYWRNGFHEDGVVSALAVCRELNRSDTALPESTCVSGSAVIAST